MGKFKPFLFGAITGVGVIFFALNYHVIQTHEGFRIVPRTPQHSLGLAYVDIRNWTAEEWADRPEIARALVANGSTDLVSESIADNLMDSVSSESPIDQLRGFLNESPDADSGDPLFDAPGFLPIRKEQGVSKDSDFDEFFNALFPRDARKHTSGDAVTDNQPAPRTTIAERGTFAAEDVFRTGNDDRQTSNPTDVEASESPDTDSELLEDMLFGDKKEPAQPHEDKSEFGAFQEISTNLENRASQMLKRAQSGIHEEANRAVEDSANSLNRFVRDQVQKSMPDSVSSMFAEDAMQEDIRSSVPDAIKAMQNGFDPFAE